MKRTIIGYAWQPRIIYEYLPIYVDIYEPCVIFSNVDVLFAILIDFIGKGMRYTILVAKFNYLQIFESYLRYNIYAKL